MDDPMGNIHMIAFLSISMSLHHLNCMLYSLNYYIYSLRVKLYFFDKLIGYEQHKRGHVVSDIWLGNG
jgi:hypothetical protein